MSEKKTSYIWFKYNIFVLSFCAGGILLENLLPSGTTALTAILVDFVLFSLATGIAFYLLDQREIVFIASLTFWASQLAYHYNLSDLDTFLTIAFNIQIIYLAAKQKNITTALTGKNENQRTKFNWSRRP